MNNIQTKIGNILKTARKKNEKVTTEVLCMTEGTFRKFQVNRIKHRLGGKVGFVEFFNNEKLEFVLNSNNAELLEEEKNIVTIKTKSISSDRVYEVKVRRYETETN